MESESQSPAHTRLTKRLATSGLRPTPRREEVYAELLRKRDHPTAEELFMRAKRHLPEISMATVYNSLEALVACGLVRQLALERGAARYCPNMREHGHFCCDRCGRIEDVTLPEAGGVKLAPGYLARSTEVTIHGLCAACAKGGARRG